MDRQIITSIGRVFSHVSAGKQLFIIGIIFRVLERCLSILPLLLCVYWLYIELNNMTGVTRLLSTPSDYLMALGGIFLLQLICAYFGQLKSFSGSYHLAQAYRIKAITHFRRLPLGVIQTTHSSEFFELMSDDIKKVESIFSHVLPDLLSALVVPLLGVIILLFVAPLYALGLCVILPCALWIMHITKKKFNLAAKTKVQTYKHTSSTLTDYVEALKTLKLFNQTHHWLARVQKQLDIAKQHTLQVEMWGASPVLGFRVILNMAMVLFVITVALTLPENGTPPVNVSAIVFAMLILQLLVMLNEVAEHISMLRIAAQSECKVEALLKEPSLAEPVDPIIPQTYSIEFERVSFSYGGNTAINNVSFYAPEGSITAVVGETGSGKSTLLNLCARFFDPTSGCIKVGGAALQEVGSHNLHNMVSMVFQDVQLIDASILENIRIGKPEATDEEVIEACVHAHCIEFIDKLAEGIDTRVGDGGVLLSGGQRQRIAIARALLKDAPIVLLDEVTASLDPIMQADVVSAIQYLLQNRTVITVAHRLSSIVHADNILVINDGKIVESGSHRCLLSIGGFYTRLWRAESQAV
ncbi:ABC transporter ATP-binding protein [Pseudoalteromonas luteoviolacea]|uniref:ABC transporter n=1 Tax=Pseudoalteromonas luteoviolacea S4054 TaxID=1129367 RepID=A0A0F6AAP9_9GAMM|nr:ABC transporter ATP-binding protein [Pseudoalteromonas luteoviolacea]AOT10850.1 hypothetical protein S4054249_23680 [Pseudoalteromonas luteoviolacea]AOT15988.1 hypothetical protein S40542_24830 [Pseudoalteromonas luteoviolacea]AOT20671.1 hypothetical protein S4054_23600 [Pseudoalteromonas luteoviolacea]KKE82901.1 hypothetical protein N479_16645 [Pseudoalteromonas luteoviolacea S4054]KZN75218.1 hypothetical protein N481_07840 [Pseudoalteromonas luteoviolacea S4047-1]